MKTVSLAVVSSLLGLIQPTAASSAPAVPAGRQLRGTDLLYVSHVHRGGGKNEAPDNTLETFVWCWQNGSAVECDCRKTKDGVGIMLHDDSLNRTTRGLPRELATNSVSRSLTWEQIRGIDVGSYQGARFAGQHIPTIEATFAAMKGHPTYLCMVDEKGAGPRYIAQKAIEAGVQDQVYYTGASHDNIIKWNETLPGGKALLWIGAWPKNHGSAERARADRYFRKRMAELRQAGFRGITAVSLHSYYDPKDPDDPFVPSSAVLRECIDEFHAHGIVVCSIPFQGGDLEETYFKLWDLGCDGFSTDYPSVMFEVIRKLKEKSGTVGLPRVAARRTFQERLTAEEPFFIGHRGRVLEEVHIRENTLESFEAAGQAKLQAIETDVRLTADGQLVCTHDANLKRVFGVDLDVEKATWAEVRRHPVPTFGEYLDVCAKYDAVPFIETKGDTKVVAPVLDELRQRGLLGVAVMSSSSIEHIRAVRRLDRDVFVHHIFSRPELLDEIAAMGNSGVSWNYPKLEKLPPDLIARTHAKGVKCCLRGCDTPEAIVAMRRLGLDYLPTNRMTPEDYRDMKSAAGNVEAKRITLEGDYSAHLQDAWMADGTIWWAQTRDLVKTDRSGRILKKAEVGGHHAGLEIKDGRLFTAVCAFNGEPRHATLPQCHVMIGEYDAQTLERIEMHVLDINDRAGSLCILEDGTYLVGCLRHPALKPSEVKFHHIGKDFKLIKTHVVDVGMPVKLGIEVIRRYGNDVYLFVYGAPVMRLDAKDFAVTGRFKSFGGQMGFAKDGAFAWVGVSKKNAASGRWTSGLERKPLRWKHVD